VKNINVIGATAVNNSLPCITGSGAIFCHYILQEAQLQLRAL
jgi:hypothetical protein